VLQNGQQLLTLNNKRGRIEKQIKENVTNMKDDTRPRFCDYLKELRKERKLSMRELARKAGIDSAGLTRLEQGKFAPRPETLTLLAAALEVPVTDLFARAGYITATEMPSISTYLHLCYGQLPEEAVTSVNKYISRLVEEHGRAASGPVDHEDETEGVQQ
jgi:transcriptional regulator with XRE-family HTH domain